MQGTTKLVLLALVVVVTVLVVFTQLSTPFDPLHGDGYQFFSGIGLTGFAGVGFGAWWRKHNCHVEGCPRLQWHVTEAGDIVCRKHHPNGPKSHGQVLRDHKAALNKNLPPAR